MKRLLIHVWVAALFLVLNLSGCQGLANDSSFNTDNQISELSAELEKVKGTVAKLESENETLAMALDDTSEPAFLVISDKNRPLIKTSAGAYQIYGTTSNNCERIFVEAINYKGNLYEVYELAEYSYGDTQFHYGIREDWGNLVAGSTLYKFTAYCDGNQVVADSYTAVLPTSQQIVSDPVLDNDFDYSFDTYINADGNEIQSPTYYHSEPSGASALCNDGTYSFSQNRRGTCSHHGGVDSWL